MDIQTPPPELEPHKKWFSRHMILGYVFLGLVFAAIVGGVYYVQYGSKSDNQNLSGCIATMVRARNIFTGEIKDFNCGSAPLFWKRIDLGSFKEDSPEGQAWLAKLKDLDVANWKTYTNSQYGFEFKYPNDWNEINRDIPPPGIQLQTGFLSNDFISKLEYLGGDFPSEIIKKGTKVTVRLNIFGKSGYTFEKLEKDQSGPSFTIHNIKVAGQEAIYRFNSSLGNKNIDVFFIYPETFPDKTIFISISSVSYMGEIDSTAVFDQILSTFKFN